MKSRDFRKLNETIDFSVTKSYEDEQGRTVNDMSHFGERKDVECWVCDGTGKDKYYDEAKHTPFTPALPVLYAYREAMRMMFEEGLEQRIQRHRTCSEALYSGLSALGLTPFAKEDSRSTVVIALNYLDGLEDKIFRETLAKKFKILVAGGFGNLKGKVFRVGCMGEINASHVMRCISGIGSTLSMMGYDTDLQAGLRIADDKLKALPNPA